MADQELKLEAQYGKLPFDQFALDRWDYSRPTSQDALQWKQLVKQYQAFTLTERQIYHEAAWALEGLSPGEENLPTQDQIDRVLRPHQTSFERNLCLRPAGPIWLRTCYAPELAKTYEDMDPAQGWGVIDLGASLNDERLYSFDSAWHLILTRVPSIGDCDNGIDPDDADLWPPPTEAIRLPLFDAGLRATAIIYLVDRQALEEQLVTVLWLDCHGECVWWYRIKADDLLDFSGYLAATAGLTEVSWMDDFEGVGKVFERGSLIDWIY
ncbi:Nn.00g110430.m01.CDS01 [Neocucurbitaria sp. VM-36]